MAEEKKPATVDALSSLMKDLDKLSISESEKNEKLKESLIAALAKDIIRICLDLTKCNETETLTKEVGILHRAQWLSNRVTKEDCLLLIVYPDRIVPIPKRSPIELEVFMNKTFDGSGLKITYGNPTTTHTVKCNCLDFLTLIEYGLLEPIKDKNLDTIIFSKS